MNNGKLVNCGCGGNVDIHFIGNTYIGDYHKFTGKYFICCEKCGVKTPICKTREEAIEVWNRVMGERIAKVETNWATYSDKGFNIVHIPYSYKCGDCGCWLEKTYNGKDINYCPNCGAKLDWSGNE